MWFDFKFYYIIALPLSTPFPSFFRFAFVAYLLILKLSSISGSKFCLSSSDFGTQWIRSIRRTFKCIFMSNLCYFWIFIHVCKEMNRQIVAVAVCCCSVQHNTHKTIEKCLCWELTGQPNDWHSHHPWPDTRSHTLLWWCCYTAGEPSRCLFILVSQRQRVGDATNIIQFLVSWRRARPSTTTLLQLLWLSVCEQDCFNYIIHLCVVYAKETTQIICLCVLDYDYCCSHFSAKQSDVAHRH